MSDVDPASRKAADADLVQAVLHAASEVLPDDALVLARDLVEWREPEEGLVQVAWAISDARSPVPPWVVAAIRDVTAGVIPPGMLPADLDDLVK